MKNKKLIIFDFDGVIYDATEMQMQRIIDSASLALNQFETKSKVPSHNFLKKYWGISILQMSQVFMEKLHWNKNEANLFLFYEKGKKDYFEDGLANSFHKLAVKIKDKGLNMAICSNRYSASFYKLAKELRLNIDDFEFIILGDSLLDGIRKPDKRVLDPIFRTYTKNQVILVGDTILSDLKTAINSKIDFIGISSILHSRLDFTESFKKAHIENDYFVLDKLSQLETLLT
ncbi:MAG TPA: HAD-IA family hydrolase [Patescibacteria group bacterium]|nr:HAD-IA family hydrolase [Patescibacteria group bacterium]